MSKEFHSSRDGRHGEDDDAGSNFRRFNSLRQKRGAPFPGIGRRSRSGLPPVSEQTSYHDKLEDCQGWIQQTMNRLLDQELSSQSQEHQSSLWRDIEQHQRSVNEVKWLGDRLIEENAGNSELCADILKQSKDLKDKYFGLIDAGRRTLLRDSDSTGQRSRPVFHGNNHGNRWKRPGNSSDCVERDQLLCRFRARWQDCQSWSEAMFSGMLEQCSISGKSEAERRQKSEQMLKEISEKSEIIHQVCSMSKQLQNMNRNDRQLCEEIESQRRSLKDQYNSLKDIAEQIGEDESRKFECGHTEKLDRYTSLRRVNNQFCSDCWPLASQLQKEKLLRRNPNDMAIRRIPITEENEETTAEYFKVHDRVMRYAKKEHGIELRISSIERIENPVLDSRLYHVYNELYKKDCVPELLFHGTKENIAEVIIRNGFKVGSKGMFGAGIYFATDSTKSAQYCEKFRNVKSLLLCEVVLGKTMVCTAPQSDLTLEKVRDAGYDSVFAKRESKKSGGVLNDEYIVYRAEQAAPRYLVKSGSDCTLL